MKMLCLALIITILKVTVADIKPIYDFTNPEVKCIVNYLLKNLGSKYKPTALIFQNDNIDDVIPEKFSFFDMTVTEAVKNHIPFIITDNISGVKFSKGVDKGTLFSLSYFENCEMLTNITNKMRKGIKYYIIINKVCESIVTDTLNELQVYKVKFFISDQNDRRFISLSISTEINEKSCQYDGRITKDIFKECSIYLNDIQDKNQSVQAQLDLKKCKFNVGMASLYPYSIIKNKEYLKMFDPLRLDDMQGSDVEIIKIIANYFNASLNVHYVDRNEENPYNDTEYLNFVINGSLDVCVGGLYKIYGNVVSYSGVYSSQAIIFVYTVERSPKSWQKLVGKTHGLYIFLIFYFLYSIIWKIVCKFDGNAVSMKDTLLYSWGALVGASSLQDARTVKQKFLNILFLIMSLYLSTYVSCQIYSYFTIEEPAPLYKTVDELKTSEKRPYLVPVSKYFVNDKKYESFANSSLDCFHFDDCEVKLLENNASTVLIDGYLPRLQSRTAVDDEARVLKVSNEILIIYHEMIIRKYSPFVNSYRQVTQRLFESGICQKLYEAAMGITVVDRAKKATKHVLSNSYSCTVGCQITLLQLSGIFYLWILGCGVSFFIFVIEIITGKTTIK